MNRLDTFISQLDGLVVFLATAHDEVFQMIKENELTWFPDSQDPQLPNTVMSYKATISNAAFLLGYAYFEAFLADLARSIYQMRPVLLSKEKQITFKEILDKNSKEDIIRLMIEKEIRIVFGGSIEDVEKHFTRHFKISWPKHEKLIEASRMRNCLMHNGGIVDGRLAEVCNRSAGTHIRLEPNQVHSFGIIVRGFARNIWSDAYTRHLQENG